MTTLMGSEKATGRAQTFTELNYSPCPRHFSKTLQCENDSNSVFERWTNQGWQAYSLPRITQLGNGCTPRLVLPVTQVAMSRTWLAACSDNSIIVCQDFTGQDLPDAATPPYPREQGDVSALRGGNHMATQISQHPDHNTMNYSLKKQDS